MGLLQSSRGKQEVEEDKWEGTGKVAFAPVAFHLHFADTGETKRGLKAAKGNKKRERRQGKASAPVACHLHLD